MSPVSRSLAVALVAAAAVGTVQAARAAPADDRFLEGVASAYLELHFGIADAAPVVRDGVLWLDPDTLDGADPDAVRRRLDGVHGLEVVIGAAPAADRDPAVTPRPAPFALPAVARTDRLVTGFLPEDQIFESPLADPRSPAIGGGLLSYQDDEEFGIVGRVDFGGSLPLYGWEMGDGLWQVGLQGGVFSIFDLERSSSELINADYLIALPLEARYGDLTGRVRVLHQSSHLGDEFLLRTGTDRINLSYEAVDALLGYDVLPGLRVYGGGSSLIRKSPDDLDPFGLQVGADYHSPTPVLTSITYPVAGIDVRSFEETDWDPSVSLKGGVELRNGFLAGTRVQILGEYFTGRSPNGQFYDRDIDYVGVGLRVLF